MMGKLADRVFFRTHHLCPRWMCFTFDNHLRRLVQNPDKIISPYVREGSVALDVGPGIGFFTIPMAKMVGASGRVIAADIQQSMLDGIEKRAFRAGVRDRIELHLSSMDTVYAGEKADFILAFWMAHEVPDQRKFFTGLLSVLKDNGKFLMVEPKIHVTGKQFDAAIQDVQAAGFKLSDKPAIALSLAALFMKAG